MRVDTGGDSLAVLVGVVMLTEALASTGGTALVTVMVTDGWEDVKGKFARLFGRGEPREAETAAARLEQSQAALAGLTHSSTGYESRSIPSPKSLASLLLYPSAAAPLTQPDKEPSGTT